MIQKHPRKRNSLRAARKTRRRLSTSGRGLQMESLETRRVLATVSSAAAPQYEVDGQVIVEAINFPATDFTPGAVVTDVEVDITFLKTDGSCSTPRAGFAFHSGFDYSLRHAGTTITLLNGYTGGTPTDAVTVTLDDAGPALGGTPTSGVFSPVDPLSSFNGLAPDGDWEFLINDTSVFDPLCHYQATITLETDLLDFSERSSGSLTSVDSPGTITSSLFLPPGSFPAGEVIDTVTASLSFHSTDSTTCFIHNDGGSAFPEELSASLTSPGGTTVQLLDVNTLGVAVDADPVSLTFDDAAGAAPSGAPVSGTFQPVDLGGFGQLAGEAPSGFWVLDVDDDSAGGPQCLINWSLTVNTTNATLPTAEANGPYNVNEGDTVTLSAAGSTAPAGTIVTYEWDLDNNGTFETMGASPTFDASALDGPTTQIVNLRVTDNNGGMHTDSATVNVNNIPPSLTNLAATSVDENGMTTLTGNLSDVPADSFTININWGDPLSPGNVETQMLPAGTTVFSFMHQYLDDNPTATPADDYVITVDVMDDDGASPAGGSVVANLEATLGNGADGEAIAFNPNDGLIYHTSGRNDGDEFFEQVNPTTFAVGANLAPGNTYSDPAAELLLGLEWYAPLSTFVATDLSGDVFHIDTAGNFTFVGTATNEMRGLAAVGTQLFGVNPFVAEMYQLDPASGAILNTLPLTLDGTPTRGNGIAHDPTTNTTFALLRDPGNPMGATVLATLDTTTGAGTTIASTGQRLSGLTVDATGGLWAVSGDGNNLGTPEALYSLTTTLPGANTTLATVSNVDPVAVADMYNAGEDAVLNVAAAMGLLNNDTDVGTLDTHTVTGINGTASLTGLTGLGATITVQADGSFSYDPTNAALAQVLSTGDSVNDTFTYTIADDDGGTAAGTVSITVAGQDPVEVNTSYDFVAPVAPPTNPGGDGSADSIVVEITGGNLQVSVNGNLIHTTPNTTAPITLTGSSDVDNFTLIGLESNTVTVDGLAGNDTLATDDTADTDADTASISANMLNGVIDSGSLTFNNIEILNVTMTPQADSFDLSSAHGNVNSLIVDGGAGNDIFDATPGSASISVNGNDPTVAPGDTLNLTTGVVATPIVFLAGTNGAFTTPGNQGVSWMSIESFTINGNMVNVGDLFVCTTANSDRVILSAGSFSTTNVRIGGTNYGPFAVTGIARVFGKGQDDIITAASNLSHGVELDGGDGNDYLSASGFDDTLVGGGGNDTLIGGDGNNLLEGGTGNDSLATRGGDDRLFGGDGNDSISAGGGNDVLVGGAGNDNLSGGDGDDLLVGGITSTALLTDGNDSLTGGRGNDVLIGNDGNDLLRGSDGIDLLVGGPDEDEVRGERDADTLFGAQAANENDLALLEALLAEWTASQTRVNLGTITDDGGIPDTLYGGTSSGDEFNLFLPMDAAQDPVTGDTINNL